MRKRQCWAASGSLTAFWEASGNGSRENLHAGTNCVCCYSTVWKPSTILLALGLWELQIFKGFDTERLFWWEQTWVNISTDTSPVDTVLTRDGFLNLRYAASEEVQGKKKNPKQTKKPVTTTTTKIKLHVLNWKLKWSLIKITCLEIWTSVEFPAPQTF